MMLTQRIALSSIGPLRRGVAAISGPLR
jgi:hypothetical protein